MIQSQAQLMLEQPIAVADIEDYLRALRTEHRLHAEETAHVHQLCRETQRMTVQTAVTTTQESHVSLTSTPCSSVSVTTTANTKVTGRVSAIGVAGNSTSTGTRYERVSMQHKL